MKVTNLETSQKLKELGFEAETVFYFLEVKPDIYEAQYSSFNRYNKSVVKSYDLETILEALPKILESRASLQISYRTMINLAEFHYITRQDNLLHIVRQLDEESLANTAGRLLVKLLQDNIIKLRK